MNKPFFSIITCTYNIERFINKCLESVERQEYKDYEHIIVDGKSTDRTLSSVKKFSSKKIKLISSKPKGIANAMNVGIKYAKGKYLLHLNSDDFLFENHVLGDTAHFLTAHHNLDWIYGKINVVEDGGKPIGTFPNQALFHLASPFILKFVNYIPHQAVLIKKKVFDQHGLFDESLRSSMDTEYWLRIANKTNWRFFDKVISNYTIHKDAQSSGKQNFAENMANLQEVRSKYLSSLELKLANIIALYINKINKTLR